MQLMSLVFPIMQNENIFNATCSLLSGNVTTSVVFCHFKYVCDLYDEPVEVILTPI